MNLPNAPTYPAITIRGTEHFLEETFDEQTSLTDSDYIFDCWAETYSDAKTLSDALRGVLKNHKGNLDTIQIGRTVLTAGPVPIFEYDLNAYRVSQTFTFTHKQI